MSKRYNVFTRTWWEKDETAFGGLSPKLGRKTFLEKSVTKEEAISICKEYNESHEPGILSRKAEFEEV